VIVYAGAIVVLFLFVIMFLGVDKRENIESDPLRGQRPLAVVLMSSCSQRSSPSGVNAHWATGSTTWWAGPARPRRTRARLGRSVFTTYLFAFEATAGLLVIAVVGRSSSPRRPPESTGEADLEESEGPRYGERRRRRSSVTGAPLRCPRPARRRVGRGGWRPPFRRGPRPWEKGEFPATWV